MQTQRRNFHEWRIKENASALRGLYETNKISDICWQAAFVDRRTFRFEYALAYYNLIPEAVIYHYLCNL